MSNGVNFAGRLFLHTYAAATISGTSSCLYTRRDPSDSASALRFYSAERQNGGGEICDLGNFEHGRIADSRWVSPGGCGIFKPDDSNFDDFRRDKHPICGRPFGLNGFMSHLRLIEAQSATAIKNKNLAQDYNLVLLM